MPRVSHMLMQDTHTHLDLFLKLGFVTGNVQPEQLLTNNCEGPSITELDYFVLYDLTIVPSYLVIRLTCSNSLSMGSTSWIMRAEQRFPQTQSRFSRIRDLRVHADLHRGPCTN